MNRSKVEEEVLALCVALIVKVVRIINFFYIRFI